MMTMTTTKRTNERTPLLTPQQPTRIALDQYDRPIVDAMMPHPVDAGQCVNVMTSFSAKDLREKDREDHLICTNCTAPSKPKPKPPQQDEEHEEEEDEEEKPTGAEPSTAWRCVHAAT